MKLKIVVNKEMGVYHNGVQIASVRRLPNGHFEVHVNGVSWETDERRENYGEPSLVAGKNCIVLPSQQLAQIYAGIGIAKAQEK